MKYEGNLMQPKATHENSKCNPSAMGCIQHVGIKYNRKCNTTTNATYSNQMQIIKQPYYLQIIKQPWAT